MQTIKVRLPENLGVKACGPYKAGQIYEVDEEEANRLVEVKRFERVDDSNPIEES